MDYFVKTAARYNELEGYCFGDNRGYDYEDVSTTDIDGKDELGMLGTHTYTHTHTHTHTYTPLVTSTHAQ